MVSINRDDTHYIREPPTTIAQNPRIRMSKMEGVLEVGFEATPLIVPGAVENPRGKRPT